MARWKKNSSKDEIIAEKAPFLNGWRICTFIYIKKKITNRKTLG